MSVTGNFTGGVVRPVPVRLTTTNQTTIITAADSGSIVAAWSLANETGAGVVVDCHYNDGSTDFLVYRTTVPATDTVIVSSLPLRLYSGDTFKVTAATGNAITVTPVLVRSHANEPVIENRLGLGR